MDKTTNIIGACLLAASLSGCGGSNEFKPTEGTSAGELFAQACSSCHGENGNGKFGFLLKIADNEKPLNEIVNKIRNGGKIMPAFPNISEEEALSLAGYLKGE